MDGLLTEARLGSPEGLTTTYDQCILIADAPNNVLRVIGPGGTRVSTLAGTGKWGAGT
jgi:hypothetical protein